MAEKNSNKKALEKIQEKLECSICMESFSDPKLLPCFHVFCQKCLEPLVVQDRNGLSLQCPVCRHSIQLPPKGVSGLQSDFHVDHLFEISDALEKVNVTGSQPTKCEKCEEEEATYCKTCAELICYDCTWSIKLHQGHEFTHTFPEHKDEITASLEPVKEGVKESEDQREAASQQTDQVPLYRYWNGTGDHFYTTDYGELGPGAHGWSGEGVTCKLYSTQHPGTVPLYRYWNGGIMDHFYTTNPYEIETTLKGVVGKFGYKSEGIAGYCFQSQQPGTVPLYRYYNGLNADHFYTTNAEEIGTVTHGLIGYHGYKSEGITCYVYPM